VLTKTEVREIAGMPGDFTVTIRRGDDHSTVRVGAIVVASGWQPEDQAGQAHLGLGESADVVTSVMLEQMAREGPLVRPSDGRAVASVAFVQRPRPREEHRSPFGPEVIDLVSLKQALYVRERNRAADVYILCEDIVTPGHYEDFYRRVQQEPRVFFIKGEVTAVTEDEGGELRVVVERSSLGEQLQVPVDLVVLATEMVPAGTDWLNLRYMRGPGLPTEASGFTTSNFICFPYESQRTGIYVAGGAREPMDIPRSLEDAAGAALKAVQSVALAARGGAAHPRSGDLSLPHTRRADCTKCGRCPQECPFSAIELDEDGFPVLQPNRCRRCGICMGACPVQAISFENYSVGQLSAMIKAIRPPADQSQLRILALVCENDAYPAFDAAGVQRLTSDNSVRVIPLRCLGSLNTILIADALSHGIDGIMLMGCKTGDDYQCHFIRGSELATTRMENVQETLQRLLLEPERVQTMEVEIADHHRIPQIVEEFVAGIRRVGPNPFRGF
jgi:quinone-modifying oxidoreductase subunit QmoB